MHAWTTYGFLHARGGVGGRGGGDRREAELMHHPVGLGALAGTATVVDERLLQPDGHAGTRGTAGGSGVDWPVDAGGLPEAGAGDPVWPDAVPVLPPPEAEEVPLFLPTNRARLCVICKSDRKSLSQKRNCT